MFHANDQIWISDHSGYSVEDEQVKNSLGNGVAILQARDEDLI